MSKFKVGQKVVCVNDDHWKNVETFPQKGEVYTIESLDGKWLYFEGYEDGSSFEKSRFKPLSKPKKKLKKELKALRADLKAYAKANCELQEKNVELKKANDLLIARCEHHERMYLSISNALFADCEQTEKETD